MHGVLPDFPRDSSSVIIELIKNIFVSLVFLFSQFNKEIIA